MIRKNYTFKLLENNKVVRILRTHSKRRFLNGLRTIKWDSSTLEVYLRVYYGRFKDCFNKETNFYNDGFYQTKDDLWQAFEAFDELTEEDFQC